MTELPFHDVADDLVEWGYLEEEKLGNRQSYYMPTDKALKIANESFSPESGGEKGGEGLIHRIGVRLTATYYDQQGYDVEMYHSPSGIDDVYDVYADATPDSPDDRPKVVEVETCPNNEGHVPSDYKTLSVAPGEPVWVVENTDGAENLIDSLSSYIENRPPKGTRNFETFNEHLNEAGMETLLSINNLREEVN
jgi:hypothetical protein